MNISFLPRTIKEQFKKYIPSGDINDLTADVVRSTTDSQGNSGESYIIFLSGMLYIYSRSIGDFDFNEKQIKISEELKDFSFEQENYKITVTVRTNLEQFILRFSSFDIEDIEKIRKNIHSYMTEENPLKKETEKPENTIFQFQSKLEVLAAALMYLSTVDKEIDVTEDKYIANLFYSKKNFLSSALNYFKNHSFEEFLNDCGPLSDDESLCILTHLIELGFVDASLHTSEQQLIKKFCTYHKIPNETYDAVVQVIFAKNNISVLY